MLNRAKLDLNRAKLVLYRAKQGNFRICPVGTGQCLLYRAKTGQKQGITGRPVLSGQFGKYARDPFHPISGRSKILRAGREDMYHFWLLTLFFLITAICTVVIDYVRRTTPDRFHKQLNSCLSIQIVD